MSTGFKSVGKCCELVVRINTQKTAKHSLQLVKYLKNTIICVENVRNYYTIIEMILLLLVYYTLNRPLQLSLCPSLWITSHGTAHVFAAHLSVHLLIG